MLNLIPRARAKLLRMAEPFRTSLAQRRWHRIEAALPRTPDGRLLLHVGCGEVDAPHFVNVDARSLPHVHLVASNLLRLRMIPDAVADMVYMCHVLEHVEHRHLRSTLCELRRTLKSGGVLRLSVPDFDKMLRIYETTGNDILSIEQPMMGGQDYPQNFHYCLFNANRMEHELTAAGFVGVQHWDPASCDHHDFVDWANKRISYDGGEYEVSLNMQARAR